MSVQDDVREKNMVRMFNLKQAVDRKRHDPDAYLDFEGERIQFELKSTTTGSLSTVRDFGPDHVKKWETMHWIVGFYDKNKTDDPNYCVYISPSEMKDWIDEIWEYVKPDYQIADLAPQKLQLGELFKVCGEKDRYTISDAKSLNKNQYKIDEYRSKMDLEECISKPHFLKLIAPSLHGYLKQARNSSKTTFNRQDLEELTLIQSSESHLNQFLDSKGRIPPSAINQAFPPFLSGAASKKSGSNGLTLKRAQSIMRSVFLKKCKEEVFDIPPGYSAEAMLEIFRHRSKYLIERGSTLNNPHIPPEFFSKFEKISENHASSLRELLSSRLKLTSELVAESRSVLAL